MLYCNLAHSLLDVLVTWTVGGLRHHDRPPRILGFGVYRSRRRATIAAARLDAGGLGLILLDAGASLLSTRFEYVEAVRIPQSMRIVGESE